MHDAGVDGFNKPVSNVISMICLTSPQSSTGLQHHCSERNDEEGENTAQDVALNNGHRRIGTSSDCTIASAHLPVMDDVPSRT